MRNNLSVRITALALVVSGALWAGNPQRAGQAGASELLINPWARNAAWGGVNVAGVTGVQASFLNVAGTANTERTDIAFANTNWLMGAGISVNSFGLNQHVGDRGVLGASLVAVNYGDFDITNEANPNGGLGTISPTAITIGMSYAQRFTESIRGGINIKVYNASSNNLSTTAMCFDAGVQYVTGEDEKVKFGITLRNIGPSASYKGDGQVINLGVPGGQYSQAYKERSSTYELPVQLSLGGSYDFNFDENRVTMAVAFQSNSFQKDQFTVGGEYSFREKFMLRGGYSLYNNTDDDRTTSAISGLSAGAGVKLDMGESDLVIDYSYSDTDFFDGIHSIGIAINLK